MAAAEGDFLREAKTLEQRLALSRRVLETYPDRVPIIVRRSASSKLPPITRQKFIVPDSVTFSRFVEQVKMYIPNIGPGTAIHVFLDNGMIPLGSTTIRQVYAESQAEDGFLYLNYTEENAFGYVEEEDLPIFSSS